MMLQLELIQITNIVNIVPYDLPQHNFALSTLASNL